MPTANRKLGDWGEELARGYYEKLGYEFVAANWRKRFAEIDLIVKKENNLVFCEVKTRTKKLFGGGELAVDYRKRQKLFSAVEVFMQENPEYENYFPQLDVLVVELFTLVPNFVRFENVGMEG
jgi:putative endonuclease